MLDTLFHYPRVIRRHREGPFAAEREQYLCFCASGGAPQTTLLKIARELLVIVARIDVSGERAISLSEINAGADQWVLHQHQHNRIKSAISSRTLFVQTAKTWLNFIGRLEHPVEQTPPYAIFIADFGKYMQEERGLSPKTINSRCWHVHTFLNWLTAQDDSLANLRLGQIANWIFVIKPSCCCFRFMACVQVKWSR